MYRCFIYQNELVVYVSDQVAAIPTLKNNQFTLSTLDDDEVIDTNIITAIKEFLDSIGEGHNFAVISNNDVITIQSISGKTIERDAPPTRNVFLYSLWFCHSRYQVELDVHMKIHYL